MLLERNKDTGQNVTSFGGFMAVQSIIMVQLVSKWYQNVRFSKIQPLQHFRGHQIP